LLDFFKYNLVAITATALDFTVFVFLTKIIGVWYVAAAVTSAFTGGLFAFWYNRKWVFKSTDDKIKNQAVKYVIIWFSSIFLNTFGIYLMVENHLLTEVYAKIVVSLLVGVLFNFTMNKYYVFKQHI